MSTTIQAVVRKDPETGTWIASAFVLDGTLIRRVLRKFQPSHPEALQWAYKLRNDLDLELMDEVHASRASRRAANEKKTS